MLFSVDEVLPNEQDQKESDGKFLATDGKDWFVLLYSAQDEEHEEKYFGEWVDVPGVGPTFFEAKGIIAWTHLPQLPDVSQ